MFIPEGIQCVPVTNTNSAHVLVTEMELDLPSLEPRDAIYTQEIFAE